MRGRLFNSLWQVLNMKTWDGWWDYLFGERITMIITDDSGKKREIKVTKRWLEKMQAEGKISESKEKYVTGHVLDPLADKMEYEISVCVGKDIPDDVYNSLKDEETGDIYYLIVYKNGKQNWSAIKKELWILALNEMNSVDFFYDEGKTEFINKIDRFLKDIE